MSPKTVKLLKTLLVNIDDSRHCADHDLAMAAKSLRNQRIELLKELPKKYSVRFNACRWIDDFETIAVELLEGAE